MSKNWRCRKGNGRTLGVKETAEGNTQKSNEMEAINDLNNNAALCIHHHTRTLRCSQDSLADAQSGSCDMLKSSEDKSFFSPQSVPPHFITLSVSLLFSFPDSNFRPGKMYITANSRVSYLVVLGFFVIFFDFCTHYSSRVYVRLL